MRRIILEVVEDSSNDQVKVILNVQPAENVTESERLLSQVLITAIRELIASIGPHTTGIGKTLEEAETAIKIERDIRRAGEDQQ